MTILQTAAGPGTRFHLFKALLALSLALNLFFIVGALWIRIHAPPPPISPEQRLEEMAGELGLNPEQKAASARYWQAMREHMQAMRDAVRPQIAKAWIRLALAVRRFWRIVSAVSALPRAVCSATMTLV